MTWRIRCFLALSATVLTWVNVAPAAAAQTTTESTFICGGGSAPECTFVLYASTCTEAAVVNGKPSLICSHVFLQEFSLKVGQSKTVSQLPAGFKQCPLDPARVAVFPACAK